MVHQYINNGYHIVLDVNSGAIHVVDEVVYDVIPLFEKHSSEEITGLLREKYSEEERAQAWRRVAAERLRETSAGVLHLFQPMRSRGDAVSELHYDFSVLTSREFIACMDADRSNRDMNTISRTQALRLYYKMHDKVERPISGLNAHDLEEQACIADTDAMVERAAAFFTSSKLVTKVGL